MTAGFSVIHMFLARHYKTGGHRPPLQHMLFATLALAITTLTGFGLGTPQATQDTL